MVCTFFFFSFYSVVFTACTAAKYDKHGRPIEPGGLPLTEEDPLKDPNDWGPFGTRLRFEAADFLYRVTQMSGGDIDKILQLWSGSILEANSDASGPFTTHRDLYKTIDKADVGEVPWQSFSLFYEGDRPDIGTTPTWMTAECEVWFRDPRKLIHNILGNPDLTNEVDYVPYHEYVGEKDNHRFHDFMSGDWAWKQAVSARQLKIHSSFPLTKLHFL